MKLILAVVQHQDAANLVEALTEYGFRVTRLSSQGGFLREGNVTLLLSVEAADRRIRGVLSAGTPRSASGRRHGVRPQSGDRQVIAGR